jgi:hypothetical protein
MKLFKDYRKLLLLLGLPALAVMCMTITEVIYPDDPQPNSEITIQVKLKFVAETEQDSKLAFGILAPKSWNLASNATLSLTTTSGVPKNVVTNEALTVIPSNELNPSTGTPWSSSFQARFGTQGNYGPMEWVAFESSTVFVADASGGKTDAEKTTEGTVTIKLTTGPENLRVYLAFTYCGKATAFRDDRYPDKDVIVAKLLEVGDMSGDVVDYTIAPAVSTTPSEFGWGDIFAFNFREQSSALKGADAVYLQAKVVYGDGQEKTVNEISDKTLMEHLDGDLWQRYIYPLDFFDLPAGTVIQRVEVYMTDKTQTLNVKDTSGEAFVITEAAE